MAEIFDSAKVLRWFLDLSYPDGYICPDCGASVSEKSLHSFLALKRFTCSSCGSRTRATKGTILQDSPLTPVQLYAIALLISYGFDDKEIARVAEISLPTAATWRGKITALTEALHL